MEGRRIRVRGQVQGVGFRPFIWQLARARGLRGEVLNDPEGVLIHVWGADLEGFAAEITAKAPPLAQVGAVEIGPLDGAPPEGFSIAASAGAGNQTRITPDAAACDACLAEIRDPTERRYGYPFANCTHCGPRLTIIDALPYDRAQTAMTAFPMCDACRAEYEAPEDRRFHAQPIACPDCGPRLWFERGAGEVGGAAIDMAARSLGAGEVVAIKGLGGFHLAVDARNGAAVTRLRQRKRRPAKPFALMGTPEMIGRHAAMGAEEIALLRSPAAPILLLPARGEALPEAVAPGMDTLGWMLPSTPLHHLLLDAFDGPLVLTSGNPSGEPQVIGNTEAREKLGGFADAFLMHDREIRRRLDDSVMRVMPTGPMVLRRARGQVPGTLPLPEGLRDAPPAVAYGGQMKGAICLTKGGEALLGHHLGEMDNLLTIEAFDQADADYAALFDHAPAAVACDLHPEFHASRHGAARAAALGVPLIEVQHHHAHMAACMAENGWPLEAGPVVGIILDGLGLGPDGTVWGGEVLVGDYASFERLAWLSPVPLVGGDRAQAEPWRNALMRLDAAGLGDWADQAFAERPRTLLRQAAEAGVNAPLSSSAGRLFDAVAAILGICPDEQSYEGEAAMRLEALANKARGAAPAEWALAAGRAEGALDPGALIRGLVAGCDAGMDRAALAYGAHLWMAEAFAAPARACLASGRASAVVLSGGCFQNALLCELTRAALGDGPVLSHAKVPANDGGLALGQAAVASARLLPGG
ncbi:carbamoyltransferase HypF [Dinoroseobacter sp. S375]|uniref:carbamoyltransferase HypF n=1 Tax=Dinoroseobacter sp. S375 TaxID=3415136 RepID=UPI003C7D48D8